MKYMNVNLFQAFNRFMIVSHRSADLLYLGLDGGEVRPQLVAVHEGLHDERLEAGGQNALEARLLVDPRPQHVPVKSFRHTVKIWCQCD